ncbi:hypothetical protein L227DRAFT_601448 [Lentinus tigrinus ALCF2SS1-6]|uniref:Uncharacterized protein n=1 Tax=Lentinus tigrinus ALCF2SS1-6 TaxID=1328759 RepID=A0A5C2S712_9APHY|nr:hypothetical protein L227DRAFT_601448 [Lentinus tigrinus ALCF2SS1-6]
MGASTELEIKISQNRNPDRRARDPSTQANWQEVASEHVDFDWTTDFTKKTISGSATHLLRLKKDDVNEVIFDTVALDVTKVIVEERPGNVRIMRLWVLLRILFPPSRKVGDQLRIQIFYSSTKNCTAVQWLGKEQTQGKSRSTRGVWLPCRTLRLSRSRTRRRLRLSSPSCFPPLSASLLPQIAPHTEAKRSERMSSHMSTSSRQLRLPRAAQGRGQGVDDGCVGRTRAHRRGVLGVQRCHRQVLGYRGDDLAPVSDRGTTRACWVMNITRPSSVWALLVLSKQADGCFERIGLCISWVPASTVKHSLLRQHCFAAQDITLR